MGELENQSEKEVEIVRSTALSEKEMEIIKSENFLKEIQICVKDLRKKLKKRWRSYFNDIEVGGSNK